MAGMQYVGADYTKDNNPTDVVNKLDVDFQCANNPVSQTSVASQIATAVAGRASQVSVNNALAAFIQPDYITAQEVSLIPLTSVGVPSAIAFPNAVPPTPVITGVAPLNASGFIPGTFIPSLGQGYCLGPFGPTATFSPTGVGSVPVKICDWAIGVQSMPFQPMVFMSVAASAVTGGRPIIEVRISAGPNSYINQTLVARGVGRSAWNDLQAVTVLPTPSAPGHSGVAGTGFASNYNIWLTAWIYDVNNQGVSVNNQNIATASVYLIRNQA